MSSDKPARLRLTQIDGLRGIAALSVIAYHYTTRYDELFAHSEPLPISMPYGYLGVQLFFVISGFVILLTLDNTRRPMDFVFSRFSRLFPVYWAAVLFTTLLLTTASIPGHQPTARQMLGNLTMVQERFGIPSIDGVYWSLEVELLFYVWMLSLWVTGLLRRPVAALPAWMTLSILVYFSEQRLGRPLLPYSIQHVMLLLWIPWFAMGIAAYLARLRGRIDRPLLVLVTLAALTIGTRSGWPSAVLGLACFYAIHLAAQNRLTLMGWAPIVYFGAISYPLYLLHEKIGWVTILESSRHGLLPPSAAILLAFGLSIAAATAVHVAVERPVTGTLRRWYGQFQKRPGQRTHDAQAATYRLRWGAICAAILCVVALGGRISAFVAEGLQTHQAQPRPVLNAWSNSPSEKADSATCAELSARGFVMVVVLGQSNAASHGAQGSSHEATWTYFDHKCGLRLDPLPGTTGSGASLWSHMSATLKTEAKIALVIAPFAIGNTKISDWVNPGPLNTAFTQFLRDTRSSGLPILAVAWQQGEADMLSGTPQASYRNSLEMLSRDIRDAGIEAPIFIAKSTFCKRGGTPAVRRAIDRFLQGSADQRVRPGPDTDQLVGDHRSDGCHFSEAGLTAAGDLWAKTLASTLSKQP